MERGRGTGSHGLVGSSGLWSGSGSGEGEGEGEGHRGLGSSGLGEEGQGLVGLLGSRRGPGLGAGSGSEPEQGPKPESGPRGGVGAGGGVRVREGQGLGWWVRRGGGWRGRWGECETSGRTSPRCSLQSAMLAPHTFSVSDHTSGCNTDDAILLSLLPLCLLQEVLG